MIESTTNLLHRVLCEHSDNPSPSDDSDRSYAAYRSRGGRASRNRTTSGDFHDDDINIEEGYFDVSGSYELKLGRDGDYEIIQFVLERVLDVDGKELSQNDNPELWEKITAKTQERQIPQIVDAELDGWEDN